jgi:transcriptional regulator with XRE-family HTH domain
VASFTLILPLLGWLAPAMVIKMERKMKSENPIQLGRRLKKIRKMLKISQTNFAASLSISNNFLSAIERGRANPTIGFLYKGADNYHISFNYLFYRIGAMFLNPKNEFNKSFRRHFRLDAAALE